MAMSQLGFRGQTFTFRLSSTNFSLDKMRDLRSVGFAREKTGSVKVATSRIGAVFNTDARSNGSTSSPRTELIVKSLRFVQYV